MKEWIEKAVEIGFNTAVQLDPQMLVARADIRAMCAADKCGAYHKNWTCPPVIGTVGECQQKMQQYGHGILVQTIGHMQKTVDSKCYRETEQRHLQQLYALFEEIRRVHPDALCLGAGGCRVCGQCAYPQPCRFPEKALGSMEGYCIDVYKTVKGTELKYINGENTVTYFGIVLFKEA